VEVTILVPVVLRTGRCWHSSEDLRRQNITDRRLSAMRSSRMCFPQTAGYYGGLSASSLPSFISRWLCGEERGTGLGAACGLRTRGLHSQAVTKEGWRIAILMMSVRIPSTTSWVKATMAVGRGKLSCSPCESCLDRLLHHTPGSPAHRVSCRTESGTVASLPSHSSNIRCPQTSDQQVCASLRTISECGT
jgi:hypothetical protein